MSDIVMLIYCTFIGFMYHSIGCAFLKLHWFVIVFFNCMWCKHSLFPWNNLDAKHYKLLVFYAGLLFMYSVCNANYEQCCKSCATSRFRAECNNDSSFVHHEFCASMFMDIRSIKTIITITVALLESYYPVLSCRVDKLIVNMLQITL